MNQMSIQAKFEIFDALHPNVYWLFRRFTRELANAGRTYYGAKSIMERIRWHYDTTSRRMEPFKINNSFTSRYVRKLIQQHPEFRGFFRVRRLRAN